MWQTWISFVVASILFVVALIQKDKSIYWVGNLIIAILTLWASLAHEPTETEEEESAEEQAEKENEGQ
jgi:hypothetical protein